MDGNKRWAKKNKFSLKKGYFKGLEKIKFMINECINHKIQYLTIFALSTDNLMRPTIGTIFEILISEFKKFFEELDIKKSVKVKVIGKRNNLPKEIINIINEIENYDNSNIKLNLNIAFNYGTDEELLNAVKKIANLNNINKKMIYDNLYLSNIPDPDLLIRTGGYKRLSNFILLNLSYTELFFIETLWPDFSEDELLDIFKKFYKIQRNYGL